MREHTGERRKKQKAPVKETGQLGQKLDETQLKPKFSVEKSKPGPKVKKQDPETDRKDRKSKAKKEGQKLEVIKEEKLEPRAKKQESEKDRKKRKSKEKKEELKPEIIKEEEKLVPRVRKQESGRDRKNQKEKGKKEEQKPEIIKEEGKFEPRARKQEPERDRKNQKAKGKKEGQKPEIIKEEGKLEPRVRKQEPERDRKNQKAKGKKEEQKPEIIKEEEKLVQRARGQEPGKDRKNQKAKGKKEERKSEIIKEEKTPEIIKEEKTLEFRARKKELRKDRQTGKLEEKKKEEQKHKARVEKEELSKAYTRKKVPKKRRPHPIAKLIRGLLVGVVFALHFMHLLSNRINLKRMRPNKTVLLLSAVLLVALMGVFWGRATMRDFVERYDDGRMLTGISIDGVDVSGMTRIQASEELRTRLTIYRENNLIFTIEERESFSGTFGEIGLSFENLDDVVSEALEHGREGSLIRRAHLQRRANRGRLNVDFPLRYEISLNDLTGFLKPHMEERLNTPVNARIESSAGGVNVIPDQSGEVFDIEEAYERILNSLNHQVDRARFTVDLTIMGVEAEIVANQLKEITDLLGTFTTSFADNNPSRAQNVENGASRMNHLFMMPGEELSACNLMGPYTEENGYAYGSMFMGNLTVEAIGGGICQVASTLYNALLYAEIEILQRNAHSIPVTYVAYSRDAAIAEGLLDLRWRNDRSTPIYIEAVIVPGQTITFNIFGKETRPANRRIEFVSEATYGDLPQGTQFVASEYGVGAMWVMSEARPLISAYLTKVIYIDDVEVERVRVNFSYYQESPRIMSVGTGSDNPGSTSLMLGAISSQNYDTIRDTINQILFGWQPVEASVNEAGNDAGGYFGGYEGGYFNEHSGGY